MHQASANVGVATANLYPQITLSASGGGIGTSFTQRRSRLELRRRLSAADL